MLEKNILENVSKKQFIAYLTQSQNIHKLKENPTDEHNFSMTSLTKGEHHLLSKMRNDFENG